MTPIVLALAVTALLLLALALFSRGGAGEPMDRQKVSGAQSAAELAQQVQGILSRLGLSLERTEASAGRVDLTARDDRPLVGQRIYLRVFGAPGTEAVGSAEVQSALDRLKDGFHKAILISGVGFSDEAISAAEDSAVELLDGAQLAQLALRYAASSSQAPSARPGPASQGSRPG